MRKFKKKLGPLFKMGSVKKNKKKGVHGQKPVWTPFFFMFYSQNHSVQLTAPKTMPMMVPRMRNKRRNVCLVFLVIILSLCAKRSQQGGCHGYNNLYNDFPNTNFSHNI